MPITGRWNIQGYSHRAIRLSNPDTLAAKCNATPAMRISALAYTYVEILALYSIASWFRSCYHYPRLVVVTRNLLLKPILSDLLSFVYKIMVFSLTNIKKLYYI